MAKQKKSEKRAKKREQKLRKQKAIKAAMPAILRHNPLLAEALKHHYPLHSCLINEKWHEAKMANIFISREATSGIVIAGFLVDLLGRGLKDAWGNYGLDQDDLKRTKSKVEKDGMKLVPCELSLAGSIIHGGVEWAEKWGAKLPRDYKVWMRILDPIDTGEIDLHLFGRNGKPLFILDEDDDFFFDDSSVDLDVLKGPLDIEEGSPSRKQLERIGDIKGTLIKFSTNPEFSEELNDAKSEYFGEVKLPKDMKEEDSATFLDWYTLEWQSEFGDTFPERFVEAYGDLMSQDIQEMILGWRGVIDGIFEVMGKGSGGYHMKNLINEQEYVVYPTALVAEASQFEIGDFMSARIVPVRDFHTFSGITAKMPYDGSDKERGAIYKIALKIQTRYPGKAFKDNEEKLKKSMELIRKDYDEYVGYFGSDELIGSGREMVQRHRDFLRYTMFDKKDPQTRLSKAEKYEREHGKAYQLPQINYPETLLTQPDVGMLCDPFEGATFLEEWSLFIDIFRDPDAYIVDWMKKRKAKDVIMGYLESDSVSDIPFRRMAERFPDNFTRVIGYTLEWEGFSVDMIDDLMRYYKAETFDKIPTHVAVLDSEMIRLAYFGED